MWRPVGECLPITLLRALSRMNSTGMRSQELLERMLFLNVDVHYGPVAFAAQRLEARRLIRREADWSWTLTPPIEAGVMYQGMLWGAVGSLAAAEQTASAGWVVRVAGRWAA